MKKISLLVIIATLLLAGCSGTGPIAPDSEFVQPLTAFRTGYSANNVLWGIWDVTIDPESMNAEVSPVRGPAFTANVTRFMQPPVSPIHMVQFEVLPGSDPVSGYFEVNVTLNHPFPGLNIYNGFDVRGILLSDGSVSGQHDSSVFFAGEGDTRLLNADGLTRWWNYPEFTSYESIFGYTRGGLAPPNLPSATVNGYRLFDNDELDRNFFPTVPGSVSKTYEIQFKMDSEEIVFDFQYAVDASWAEPDQSYAPDFPMEAFDLSANMQEAFNLSVSDAGSTAFYIDPTDNGGELLLNLEVYDWQAVENPDGVPGEVSAIWIEGDVLPSPVEISSTAAILPGSSDVSSVYEVTIGSLNLTQSGTESLFCTVESSWPDSYEPQVNGGEFFDYPDSPLAAYFMFDVEIDGESPYIQPTVLSIDPDVGVVDETLIDVVVTGEDFASDCTLAIEYEPGDELVQSNFEWIDSETLEVDLDLSGATIGLYDVIVTNPGADPGALLDGFEVVSEILPIWPVTQGNSAHNGYIGLDGPAGNFSSPTWTVNYTGDHLGNALPVFLSDDTAFFSIAFNYLDTNHLPAVAVDLATQDVKWTKVFNTSTHSSVCVYGVSEDGSIVLVWDWPSKDMYGLDAEDGSVLWGPYSYGPPSSDAYPALDQDGNFIMSSYDGLRSIDPTDGSQNWKHPHSDTFGWYCTPAVGNDGTIYAYFNDYRLHAIDPSDGSEKWSSYPYIGLCHNGVMYNSEKDTIVVFTQTGLKCYSDSGTAATLEWSQNYTYPWYSSSAIAPNGDVIIMDGAGVLRRLNPDTGATINSSSGWVDGYGCRLAVGDDGSIYTNNYNFVRAFNSDCTIRWSYMGAYALTGWSAPAIGQDGTLYAVKRTNGLCAFKD